MQSNRMKFLTCVVTTMVFFSAALSASTLYKGTWNKARATTSGGWKIIESDGTTTLFLDRAFKTKKAPDLKLLLVKKTGKDLTGKNAAEGAVRLGPLKSISGAQEYQIPEGTDLSSFSALVIHCEKYSELWSVAPLK